MESNTDWREHYLDSVAELDRRAAAWARLEEGLRRALREVALCGIGRDPDLDAALDRLRRAVRGSLGQGALEEQVSRVSQRARELERRGALHPLRRHLLDTLQRSECRIGARKARQMRARLDGVTEVEALPLAAEMVEACTAGATEQAAPGGGAVRSAGSGGVLRRLFRGGRARDERGVADGDGAVEAATPGLRRLRRSLAGLLRAVLGPEEEDDDGLGKRIDGMAREVQDELPELIDSLATIASDVRGRLEAERDGLKRFMASLEGRLAEMEGLMASAEQAERAHQRSEADESRRMADELAGLGKELSRHDDVNKLKSAVNRHVDQLGRQLEARRRNEQQRAAALEAQLQSIRQRMESMESETRELRERLARAKASSREDRLTGVPNRRAWEERLDYEFARWQRHGRPLSMVFFDVDHFKLVNDRLGHAAGDQALAQIADCIQQRLRRSDFMARYGGEEFVALLPETGADDAVTVAEDVLQGLRESGFDFEGVNYSVTASAGVAAFQRGDGPAAVVKRADDALYQAKRAGRDQVRKAEAGRGGDSGAPEAGQPAAQGADAEHDQGR